MPIHLPALARLAAAHAEGMPAIRSRRMQRLLCREFAGAEQVLRLALPGGRFGMLGVSASGAAWCEADGRGPHASLFKWRHGESEASELRFDLLRDSLPLLGQAEVPITELARGARRTMPFGDHPAGPLAWDAQVQQALQVLD